MQMSFLTPPFGMSLFYLKSVAPPEVSTVDVWKSAVPFLGLQFIGLVLCMYFPDIILWAPKVFLQGLIGVEVQGFMTGSGDGLMPRRSLMERWNAGRTGEGNNQGFSGPGAVCGGLLRAARGLDRRAPCP